MLKNIFTILIYVSEISMKISPIKNINICKYKNKDQNKSYFSFNVAKFDTVSFGAKLPEVDILKGVSKSYSEKVMKTIKSFPKKWLNEFRKNGYKIILSPTLEDAYKKEGIVDNVMHKLESENPQGTLGSVYDSIDKRNSNRFFVFCDKPPYSNRFMKNIINHELCHGVADIQKLSSNPQVLSLIQKDCKTIVEDDKLYKLTFPERRLINYHFFDKNAYLPIEEIIADTYAWIIGEGIYGSELTLPDKNPNLMKTLFPSLHEYLLNI